MTIVSTKEFSANQEKYFDMALDEQVYVKRGKYMFHIICSNYDTVNIKEQEILEPDDDLRSAIPMEEIRDRVIEYIRKKHVNHI